MKRTVILPSLNIDPVINEIFDTYTIETSNQAALESLHCIAILQSKKSRDCIALRTPEKGGFYYSGPAARELFKKVSSFVEAAETYPGELHYYGQKERREIMEAIRAGLIKAIQKGAKTA